MACTFPEAADLKSFWRNILAERDCIGDPVESWDAPRYLASNRIYTAAGGWLKDLYRFDPKPFGIMPNSIDGGEPDHFIALKVARDALIDAGYDAPDFDHSDTGVVLGHSTYLHRGQASVLQHNLVADQTLEMLRELMPDLGDEQLETLRQRMLKQLPQFNADVAPSLVPNVMTGRIANRLNLRGPNYILDAACSSSLLAVGAAIDELRNHRSRMMIAGGVNASLPAEVSVIFTQLGALSRRGRVRPFESGSDGTLLGEGLGMVVLKRLEDALADEDRIYAVLRGVGQASDGRATGLLAPSMDGELLAMQRAYEQSGVDPSSLGMIEAHGTGIPLGDRTEITALRTLLGERTRPMGSVAIGSVKSMISHCIPAAGIAGLIKSALALHHRVLPPTLCDEVNPELRIGETPLYVNTEARPWVSAGGAPRRAGVNSFGFGGINTHAILEQAPAEAKRPATLGTMPAELLLFSAESPAALSEALDRLENYIADSVSVELVDVAATLAEQFEHGLCRLAMVASDLDDLAKKIGQARKKLTGKDADAARWTTRSGVSYAAEPLEGKLAFLFPGEGSQYPGMLRDLVTNFGVVQEWFDFWDGLYADRDGPRRSDIMFPPKSELNDAIGKELEARLHTMDVGSEAVFVGGQAMFALLQDFGIEPDVMLGHSSGESSALAASAAMGGRSPEKLAHFIRDLNREYERVLADGQIPTGVLLAVGALDQKVVESYLTDDVVIAMENCANQLVLFGKDIHIGPVESALTAAGGICIRLPFDRGYHTRWFHAMTEAFQGFYKRCKLSKPSVPLYSCASAGLFPARAAAVQALAAEQWSNKVRFRETIEQMYADGVRMFVEVGPSGNLSAFVSDILAGKDSLVMASNQRRKSDVEQVLQLAGSMFVNHRLPEPGRLFAGRAYRSLDWDTPDKGTLPGMLLDNTLPLLRWKDQGLAEFAAPAANAAPAATVPSVAPESAAPAAPAAGHSGPQDAAEPPPVAQQADAPAQPTPMVAPAVDEAMREHFEIMREFLARQDAVLENLAAVEAEYPAIDSDIDAFPFLSDITRSDDNRLSAACRLSVYEDRFLLDHVLSGTTSESDPELFGLSCVPLMVSLEIMAEAAAALVGSRDLSAIARVSAFDWIALDHAEAELQVQAEKLDDTRCRVQLMRDKQMVVTAEYLFDGEWHLPPVAPVSAAQTYRWQDHELYEVGMFHGPVFQSVTGIAAVDEQGIDARLSPCTLDGFFVAGAEPAFIVNPVLLDALGQVAAFWIAQQVGTDYNCFPSTIERIEFYANCPRDVEDMHFIARQTPLRPDKTGPEADRLWQAECVDGEGRSLLRVSNLANVYFPVPHRFYQCRRSPLEGWMGAPLDGLGDGSVLLWQVQNFAEQFFTQSSGVFMRMLVHSTLSMDERQQWYALDVPFRRRMEWLMGRICLKEAVRYWLYQQTGELLYPSDILVLHNEEGAPYVDGWWNGQLEMAPEVSLSHDRSLLVAAVAEPGCSVGVDVEHVGRMQRPEHVIASFTPEEQGLVANLPEEVLQGKVLQIWCAKEAAAKYFGVGMKGDPTLFKVIFSDEQWQHAQVMYGQYPVYVNILQQRDTILALASNTQWVKNQ
ncbi:4'-phosphopantetheinyl transferase superfamily protein [Mangrovimicrobium sediminis]|uniref:4'-phosphopantetheinyl transferase superfamily protein n=2 Tax=Mangrovimicrobium sediminis TaxID=2562682 RepID=A0A4Z0MA46_9GAMM|nr:4'-phosphopantetheinyl transferase superfamily protein [Haliea sp. SAOS-164]